MTENTKIKLLDTDGVPTLQYRMNDEDLSNDSFVDNLIVQILADRDRIEAYVADRVVLSKTLSDISESNAGIALSGILDKMGAYDGHVYVLHERRRQQKKDVQSCDQPTTTLLGSTRCCNVYSIACIGEDYMYHATVRVDMMDGSTTTDDISSNLSPESEVKLLKTLLGGGCPEVLQDWVIGRLATLKEFPPLHLFNKIKRV